MATINIDAPGPAKEITRPPTHLSVHAVGRDQELQNLHRQLSDTQLPLVITGIGGLGKTTFAQLYWQHYRDAYDHVAWLNASAVFSGDGSHHIDNAEYFLRAFTDNVSLKKNLDLHFDPQERPVEHFRQAIDALAEVAGTNLLVVDNVAEAAAAYLEDLSKLHHWRILFTSRDAIQNMAIFRLDTLDATAATAIFERIYEQPAQSTALNAILQDIGYHTLTIELLAAYAREKGLTPPALLELLRNKGLNRLDDYEVNTPRSARTQDIAAHLRDVFLLELDAAEQDLLRNAAILPPSNIPLDPGMLTENRICLLFGQQDDAPAFKKRLRRLARMNWLSEKDGAYRCHPVVAETAKAQLLPDVTNCAALLDNVTRLLIPDEAINEHILERAHFAPLGEAVFKNLWKENGDFQPADLANAYLGGWLDQIFRNLGQLYKALDYGRKVMAMCEKILAPDDPELAHTYNNVASSYGALGDSQQRLAYNLKALSIREQNLPPDHPDLAHSYNNIAESYGALDDQPRRLEFNLKAMAIREKILPANHPDLAISYSNLAETYRDMDDYDNSLRYNQKALAIREAVLSLNHPHLATSYNNIALIYSHAGDYAKCLDYHLKCKAILEQVLPADHPDLATSYHNIALTYNALGDIAQAVGYMRRAVAILEQSLPPSHPNNATMRASLALLEEGLEK